MDKYNYTIFSYTVDYFEVMFMDVIGKNNVDYVNDPVLHYCHSRILKLLYKLHTNRYLNAFVNLPGKEIWIRYDYRDVFNDGKTKCFVFLMGWLVPKNKPLFEKLKRRYPDCKFVVYFEDIVASRSYLDMSLIDKYFDLAITYDEGDAERHGFVYFPTFMSKITLKDKEPEFDVSFIGAAKSRYDLICELYDSLSANGVKCDFEVSRLLKGQRKHDGISYIHYMIPYREYLRRTLRSHCIVEIMQENALGYTLRTWEALLYGRKLLTNNKSIVEAPFYNEDQFIVFEDVKKIPYNRLVSRGCSVDGETRYNLSPESFFEKIEELI